MKTPFCWQRIFCTWKVEILAKNKGSSSSSGLSQSKIHPHIFLKIPVFRFAHSASDRVNPPSSRMLRSFTRSYRAKLVVETEKKITVKINLWPFSNRACMLSKRPPSCCMPSFQTSVPQMFRWSVWQTSPLKSLRSPCQSLQVQGGRDMFGILGDVLEPRKCPIGDSKITTWPLLVELRPPPSCEIQKGWDFKRLGLKSTGCLSQITNISWFSDLQAQEKLRTILLRNSVTKYLIFQKCIQRPQVDHPSWISPF